MFRLKFFSKVLLCNLLFSCSTNKECYRAVSATFNDIRTPFELSKIDSVELVDYQLNFNIGIFKEYKHQKYIVLNNKLERHSANLFKWVDKKYEWIIEDSDIDYMSQSLSYQKKYLWSEKEFKKLNKKIQILDYPFFYDRLSEDVEMQKRIKEDKFVYFFSKPVFNKNKDIFIIQYEIILLPYTNATLIYKKENGKWKKIASLGTSME